MIIIRSLFSLKMTVMDRLVAELGGIETAIVALQDQVNQASLIHSKTFLNISCRLQKVLIVVGSLVKMNRFKDCFQLN